jgi:hypothetical protein
MRPEIGGIPATAALVFWILLVLASADQLFATHRFMCDSCPSRKLPIAHSKTRMAQQVQTVAAAAAAAFHS